MRKEPETVPVCAQAYVGLAMCSLSLLSDGLDDHSWPDKEEYGVDSKLYENLKIILFPLINPIRHY